MRTRNRKRVLRAEAIVHRVDTINRELSVLIGSVPVAIHVSRDCDVVLRGERVKLPMIQPSDRLRIAYAGKISNSLEAIAIQVLPTYSVY